ncbi:MAG: hypothetical protein ISEC1_P1575 [Thiomicrorhabdus sp.]|nr:MAG: hypothetical protein ISEC1_P1575 [Thiomicrorhabdus sp.]
MSNTISQNPMLAKMMAHPDGKADEANKGSLSDLVRADQALKNAQNVPRPSQPTDQFSASDQAKIAAARIEQYESAYQYSETMSLQLTTKEGDTVSVDFRQLYAEYQSYRAMESQEEGPKGVRYFESREMMEATAFEEQFAFSVNGDLNDDELKAVFNVFEQVDELANNFFDGNIEKALEKAMALEIDYGQIQSMQLNLTQAEMKATSYQKSAVSEYENVKEQVEGGSSEKATEDYGVSMSDIPPYLQQWQATIEQLDVYFKAPEKAVDELTADVASQRFPDQDSRPSWFERVQEFHTRLTEYAAAEKEKSDRLDQAMEVAAEDANDNVTEAAGVAVPDEATQSGSR